MHDCLSLSLARRMHVVTPQACVLPCTPTSMRAILNHVNRKLVGEGTSTYSEREGYCSFDVAFSQSPPYLHLQPIIRLSDERGFQCSSNGRNGHSLNDVYSECIERNERVVVSHYQRFLVVF
jgi:hypothetical protein